jgi:hypothetical protein
LPHTIDRDLAQIGIRTLCGDGCEYWFESGGLKPRAIRRVRTPFGTLRFSSSLPKR